MNIFNALLLVCTVSLQLKAVCRLGYVSMALKPWGLPLPRSRPQTETVLSLAEHDASYNISPEF